MTSEGLTLEEVEHIAMLARLSLTLEEKELFREQLSDILDYAERIQELETEGIPPTTQALAQGNVVREDQVRPSMPRDDVLENAPETYEGHIVVPTVLDEPA